MALRTEPIVLPDLAGLEPGGPRLLPIDSIDEDPDQPRTEYDAGALDELAATIRERGILQPVSVRPHPRDPLRWMLNFGSRRLRASRLASRTTIPAFVDASFDTYAQVIENEQREGLTAMELALFVKKRKALGETQTEIGRLLGKSQAYVSMAHALIDPPDWLVDLYRQGRCRGLTELYRLRRLHEESPSEVEAWCRGQTEVSRSGVGRLTNELEALRADLQGERIADRHSDAGDRATPMSSPPRIAGTSRRAVPVLLAEYDGGMVEVVTQEAPSAAASIIVRSPGTSRRRVVPVAALRLLGFKRPL